VSRGFVFSFKVHDAGCRFYAVLGVFLLLAVMAAFAWSYLHYPDARSEIRNAFTRHYIPMGALVIAGALVLGWFWRKLDS
jgi:uncharacterized membrane protein YidH (DUF202 family)